MRPLPGWAIIETEEKTKVGDVYLPESAKSDMQRGTVVALNDGYIKDGVTVMTNIEVGDTIIFKKYHDSEIEIDTKRYKGVPLEQIILTV